MRSPATTRVTLPAAALLLCASSMLLAQSSALPAAAPTSNSIGTTSGSSVPRAGAQRANVTYAGGLLHITASNSSLNGILREIAQLTGMKITGGVQEDRVFGSYGPGPASDVLATLLDGSSSNVIIMQNSVAGPAELILTPRRGGATPPNPNAPSNSLDYDTMPQRSIPIAPQQSGNFDQFNNGRQPQGPPGGLPASNGGQTGTPVDGGANIGVTPGAFTPAGQSPPEQTAQPPVTTTDSSEPQSPNGVPTPQQIYEQLQKIRQQQQNAAPQK